MGAVLVLDDDARILVRAHLVGAQLNTQCAGLFVGNAALPATERSCPVTNSASQWISEQAVAAFIARGRHCC